MAESVLCEQVVLGWSQDSLIGGDGFGPVFASAGWALPTGDRDAGLGPRARFLPQGAASLISDATPPPQCLVFEPTDGGILMLRKTYAQHSSRPGQYLVHALLDASSALVPDQLWQCAEDGTLLADQPGGRAARIWPPVEVAEPAPESASPGLSAQERFLLGVLIERQAEGRPAVIQTQNQSLGEQTLRRVLQVLPPSLARTLSISTFVADASQPGYDVCLVVPPFSRATRADLDLDAPTPSLAPRIEALVAALAAPGAKPELADVSTIDHLWSWLHVQGNALDELGSKDLCRVLEGPLWQTFLRRVDESGTSELLVDCLMDPEVAPVLKDRLLSPDAALVGIVVRALTQSRGLEVRRLGQLQDQLVGVYRRSVFAQLILPGVFEAAEQGEDVAVACTALADALVEAAASPAALDGFTWHTDTSFWSALSKRWLEQWLRDGGPVRPRLVAACRRDPEQWAGSVDELLVERRVSQAVAIERLQLWPVEDLELLITTLLRCQRVPRLFVLDVLGGFPVAATRSLLRAYWTRIAAHAQLSDALSQQLTVAEEPKRSLWARARD